SLWYLNYLHSSSNSAARKTIAEAPVLLLLILFSLFIFHFRLSPIHIPVSHSDHSLIAKVIWTLATIYIILLGALYPLPVYITSPCVLKSSDLPPKPGLIGHRGAPMLAPENTLMSFKKTVASGIKVFETDVAISQDGVPFLMHDSKLLRTTNVREVFQEQSQYNSTNFTWANLQKLDAGSWYLEKDPFKTVSVLTPPDQEEVRRQKIPALQEVLKEAEKKNISIIFDLYVYINITLETIFNSSIRPELILWLPDEQREEVIARAPGFRQIFGPLKQENDTLEAVNMPYNLSLEKIRQKNISVNLYVVNEPWLFSYVWCAGATSVTSNACHLLKDIQRPQWVLVSRICIFLVLFQGQTYVVSHIICKQKEFWE
uniref:GP-PDE domain-containing protein n=1 Tax=Xenopus tropicalis TaxID=8364 RepID=L7N2X2_XENTR